MTTPSTENVRSQYQAGRFVGQSYGEATAEFDRWLAAHDQGVRDAVKPPELTAKEHLEAAREAACPVPEGRKIPANTGYLSWRNGECVGVYSKGVSFEMPGREGDLERRTLEPLTPVIPDDCMAVWASVKYTTSRTLWVRDIGSTGSGNWASGEDVVIGEALIDPKPVPKEES